MTYAASLYAGCHAGHAADLEQLLRFVSLVVATPVVLYAAQPFFAGAWRSLRAGTLGWICRSRCPSAPPTCGACSRRCGTGSGVFRLGGDVHLSPAARTLRSKSRCVPAPGWSTMCSRGFCPTAHCASRGSDAERVTPDELSRAIGCGCCRVSAFRQTGTSRLAAREIDESLLTGESAPRVREPQRRGRSPAR